SAQRGGVGYLAVHSISWDEPIVFQQTFDDVVDPERVLALATEFLNEDNAYEVEAMWDLWVPLQEGDLDLTWQLQPQKVKFFAFGLQFEDATYQQNGHVQVDFGLDTPSSMKKRNSQRRRSTVLNQMSISWSASPQRWRKIAASAEECCGQSQRTTW